MSIAVSGGQTSSGLAVLAGNTDTVLSGGKVVSTLVSATASGGKAAELLVSSGGSASRTVVSGTSASEVIAAGGTESGGTDLGHVRNAGILLDETTGYGGLTVTLSGGTESSGTVAVNGQDVASGGGRVIDETVAGGGIFTASAGGLGSAIVVQSGGTEIATGSGALISLTSLAGVGIAISGGAIVSQTVLNSGSFTASAGGFGFGDIVDVGGTETAASGGLISGGMVGGGVIAVSGGVVEAATIVADGTGTVQSGGVFRDVTVSGLGGAGTVLTVQSGAVASHTIVAGTYAYEFIQAGGVESGGADLSGVENAGLLDAETTGHGGLTVTSSGGLEIGGATQAAGADVASSGGTVTGESVLSGGSFTASAGGLGVGIVISAGGNELATGTAALISGGTLAGSALATAGGVIEAQTITSGGSLIVSSGGTASGLTVGAGASETASAGGTIRAGVVDGSAVVSSGGTESGVTLSGGTLLVESGGVAHGAVDFDGSGGVLSVDVTKGTFGGTVSGFLSGGAAPTPTGNIINLQDFGTGATVTATAANTLLVTSGAASLTLDVAGVVAGEGFAVAADHATGLGIDIVPCFLEGTRILTETGEMAVEALAVGDLVSTRSQDGSLTAKPVTWIGRRTLTSSELPEGDRHPVRIRESAFADGVPLRDLLVTPEHCVLADGRLVPVRMLVNGRSIVIDHGVNAYTIYHVELAAHSVLIADGLPTESYLDTGNRSLFGNAQPTALRLDLSLDAGAAAWARAAAPLAVDRGFVEPVWQRLEQRAVQRGVVASHPRPALLDEPDLRLVTDTGLEIRPVLFDGTVYGFVLPAGTGSLRLRSRASRPSDTIGPFVDDRRRLGVLVGRIGLGAGRRRVALTAHLDAAAAPGWHRMEQGASCRWTDGDAALALPLDRLEGKSGCLDIQVLGAGPYAVFDHAVREDRRSA